MPSTFSPSLRIELIADGEQAGVWGQTTNNNLGDLLEQAITGSTTVNVTSSDAILTSLNGVVDEARSAVLYVTGTPGVTRVITIPNVPKAYTVKNRSNATVQIKTTSGVAYDCTTLSESYIYCDGNNVITGRTISDQGNSFISAASIASVAQGLGIAPTVSPALSGVPTAPTAVQGTNTTQLATTAFVNAEIAADTANLAPLNSPALTGIPTAPTAAVGTNTTQLATTAFVNAEIANDAPTKTGGGASGTWGISITGNAATATALTTGAKTINGGLDVINGDLRTYRSGGTTGVIYLTSGGSHYLYFDGSSYIMPNASLFVGGGLALTSSNYNSYAPTKTGGGASGTWGINITGDSAYASNAGAVGTINGAGGGTITSATTVNGNFTVNGGRPIYLENGSGSAYIRGDSGGYNLVYGFMNASGTPFGGFGAFGSNNTPSYFYVADAGVATGVYLPYGGNAWVALSDITKKIVYGKIENAVAKVCTLDALYYNYTTDSPNARRRVGLNAQQVREVLPEAVSELQLPEDEEKTLSVAYTDLIPLLVAAVKELQAEVATLKAKVGV